MRTAWIQPPDALRDRMTNPSQVDDTQPEAGMPPYMESFLAHLRLLIGVPFNYLIADERLLPDESIRFFYIDRSWTDRLVDGAISVGKTGSREQAHHQAHAPALNQQLDLSERIVRSLQRGINNFAALKASNDTNTTPASVVTGFLLRSQAVSGWPHMDVRAYSQNIPEPFDASDSTVTPKQLVTLRLELLSPSIMIALFQGVPQLVILEEPHHGIQFGVQPNSQVYLRMANGTDIETTSNNSTKPVPVSVPFRAANNSVIHVTELRRRLFAEQASNLTAVPQSGSAAFAISVLNYPWRQRFEGSVDNAATQNLSGGFVAHLSVAQSVTDQATINAFKTVVTSAH
jgi:hypothetical protein